jgi:acyl-[acyl-carrier-protein]-phospholipid O-acyltransferase/long-chain-fatty-acid--[acyl-carrier-protein] ligase
MAAAIGDAPCAVAAVPDDQRGERLVAMYVSPEVRPGELWEKLAAAGLPKLWVPKAENIYQVENLPVLGSGKLDLRGVRNLAQRLTAQV